MKISWLGHASIRIETMGRVIYIDPYQIEDKREDADIILITHEHYDHCDIKSVKNIRKHDTTILTTKNAGDKFSGTRNMGIMRPGDVTEIDGIRIIATHSYNINKKFHPKGSGIGFIIESEGKRIYHAGDSDLIPEMEDLQDIDVALLPIGGTYTMNVDDAVNAVKVINPRIAVPIHYGSIVGSRSDADKFLKRVTEETETRVEILENRDMEI